MSLLQQMAARAKANLQRIILPEGSEIRTLKAADRILTDGLAKLYLIGNPQEILDLAKQNKLSKIATDAVLVDPVNQPKKEVYANLLYELRKSKGMTPEQAAQLVENPLYLACLMIKNGDADGEVAGALSATGDVLRPALQIVRTLPGISVVSGAFLMFVPDKQYGEDGLLVFADCAVMPNPNAQELAQIAVSTAGTARSIAGFEPRVAMLSFSTKGSAKHEMVDKVTEAVRIAQEMSPKLEIDGDLQADAAIVPAIGKSKAPGSPIAGRANVLVFPSLEAGNIAYKLVQRLASAEAMDLFCRAWLRPLTIFREDAPWMIFIR